MTPAHRTARALARQTLTADILRVARRQLADLGPGQLSLRAISRELGMTSSAIYRYFPSRDELLTVLLIESYDNLGAAAEEAAAGQGSGRQRFVQACRAARAWARQRPHEWSLLYGSPVPGYAAPDQTLGPASRMPMALLRIAEHCHSEGEIVAPAIDETYSDQLKQQAAALGAALGADLPVWLAIRLGAAWTQLIGLISAELYGHLVGTFDPADEFAEQTWAATADQIGFAAQGRSTAAGPADH